MNANTAVATDFQAEVAAPAKSFWARIMDGLAARAEQQAMARMAALDPRLASEIRAARDRAEREAMNG
tara:strand:+ start:903 stop:1106 length:204 start_codon:yes stop_codon:yes gene_type:complete